MNILVSLDQNYLLPLRVMLKSLFLNNPEHAFVVYLVHSDIPPTEVKRLDRFCREHNSVLAEASIETETFDDAPVNRYYSKAMYYRLLAHQLLPGHLDRALYLDPDILVLNPIDALYQAEMGDCLFAACAHSNLTGIAEAINKIRLSNYHAKGYFNSGVLLMNLPRMRDHIDKDEIFRFVAAHKAELLLPDQDILNALYGSHILPLDDSLFNLDARRLDLHWLLQDKNMDWIMANTVNLHFCGKAKPWQPSYSGPFASLYKHYMQLACRTKSPKENQPAID